MSRDKEFRARDKKTHKMTRDGLVERNAATGEERRVSQRGQDFNLRDSGLPQQDLPLGGSVHQTISDHARHTRQSPPTQGTADILHESVRDGPSPDPSHETTEAPAQHAPGASPASEEFRQRASRSSDQPFEPSTQRHSQHDTAYHNRFSEDAPQPVLEHSRAADRASSHDAREPASTDAPGDPRVMDSRPESHTAPAHSGSGSSSNSPPAERPGRLRFDGSSTDPPRSKAKQQGTQYQRKFSEGTAAPDASTTDRTPEHDGASSAGDPHKTTDHAADSRVGADKDSASGTAPKKSKLEFAKDELPPGGKLEKTALKAEKSAAKLEAAKKKLPTKRKLRRKAEADPNTGKIKRRLHFEKEVKSQRAHVKGPLPLRPVHAAKNTGIGYVHKKIYQVEQENVGMEAAHKGELVVEGTLRTAYRMHKTRPYRRVAKLQRQATKRAVRFSYQKALAENPKLRSNLLSRMIQKRKIKRQYAKMAREAKRAGSAAKKTALTTEKIVRAIAGFVRRHPVVFGIIALLLLLIFLIAGFFSSCSNMASGGLSSVLASSYLAEDADVDNAELSYSEWETDLQLEIANAETTHSGYDEYRYNIDDIGHDPYELMAFLTSVYQDFTYAQVQAVLREIFDEQYTLTFVPEVEIRYRTETYTDPETGESYDEEVPYEWHILNVNLTARTFSDVVAPRMDSEQREIHDLLMLTKGNRQYLIDPFDFNWLPYVSSFYGYRVHPISGAKDYHKGIDIAVPTGTEILAGHDGVVTQAGSAGDYGLVVVLDDSEGLVSKYAHCSELLVSAGQEVKKGDVIAKVGSTGNSTGPHLHLEVIKDGQYLNPLYFALTGDDGTGSLPPGTPGGPEIPPYPGAPMGDGSYAALMEEAQKHLGKPYVFGAKGPDKFDCSGFVSWSLTHSGVKSIQTNAQGLYNACTPVSRENAQPGDLIFFHSTYSTSNTVTHVGIYIGNGQMIHAGKPVQYASIDTRYWQEHFYAFGRI